MTRTRATFCMIGILAFLSILTPPIGISQRTQAQQDELLSVHEEYIRSLKDAHVRDRLARTETKVDNLAEALRTQTAEIGSLRITLIGGFLALLGVLIQVVMTQRATREHVKRLPDLIQTQVACSWKSGDAPHV